MHPLYSTAQIRAIEQAAYGELAPGALMQRAGRAAHEMALTLLPQAADSAQVLVLAGPGNNGGDALVVAALLSAQGIPVTVLLHADPERYSPEAHEAYSQAKRCSARFIGMNESIASTPWELVIDGLFGIGLQRAIAKPVDSLVQQVNQLTCPILALDVPSGLDADRGVIVGKTSIAIRASHTITFIGDKPGLHTADGRDHAGKVRIANLDIEIKHLPIPRAQLNDPSLFATLLVPRKHNSHKGSYGDVVVLGGATGMHGAVLLSARAALYCGAGRTIAGFLEQAPAIDMLSPELMCRAAENVDLEKATLVIGPGLGQSEAAHHLLEAALRSRSPLVIDADGLNGIAANKHLGELLMRRAHPAILTPHPLEAARLLGRHSADIQADRLQAAQQLASQFNAIVVLKGSGSVLAHPDGRLAINPTGNPGLATAGSGDVLAGIAGALLAQQGLPWDAALAAAWLHGKAADRLAEQGVGPIGMTAGELAPAVRHLINGLAYGCS